MSAVWVVRDALDEVQAAFPTERAAVRWTHRWIGDGLLHVTRETLLTPAQAAVLEAAEAELYGAKLDLAEAARHIGDGNAFRAAMRKELEAVRAQRDSLDKLWSDAVRELQRIDDERIQVVAERDALRKDAAYDARRNADIYARRYEEQAMSAEQTIAAARGTRLDAAGERQLRELVEERTELCKTVAFFASVIKSGESWSDTCQTMYNNTIIHLPSRK